jgi:cytoplasmic tRNA 2-thiolation protein 1
MVRVCQSCESSRAVLRRPKTGESLCRECFYEALENEVHETIMRHQLFRPGERVALAASGGKDSTVLAHIVTTLNARYDYGLDLLLLSIDEGISGYRDDSLDTVKRNEATYGIPLHVFSYKDLYGWTMDEIVATVGTKSNCTFCGVFRRQALDRGAVIVGANKIATGHNADDVAETVLLNLLRADAPRLGRCAAAATGGDGDLPRVKPFKLTYEKEIVMYAYFKRLDYFSTECRYSPFAARGLARELVKDLEAARPRAILDLVRSGERLRVHGGAASNAGHAAAAPQQRPGKCVRCGYLSSQEVCKACVLLEGLNKGMPRLGISRTRKNGGVRAAMDGTQRSADDKGAAGCATAPAECCQGAKQGMGCGQRSSYPAGSSNAAAGCVSGAAEQKHNYLESTTSIPAHPSARPTPPSTSVQSAAEMVSQP